jgi:uncharacterized phosphosugar-binding protein
MSAEKWFGKIKEIIEEIEKTQIENIKAAADIITSSIAADRVVHLFGAGHSVIPVMESYPRTGGFIGYHPITELSLSYFTNVVGDMGVPQFCFLERLQGYAKVILQNYKLDPRDSMLLFSQSGVNNVVLEMAMIAKEKGLKVIAVTSLQHSRNVESRHPSRGKLFEIADVTIDTRIPIGDSMIEIDGLDHKVGPGSTIGFVAVVNAINCQVAENLVRMGKPPLVSVTLNIPGDEGISYMDKVFEIYKKEVLAKVF